MRIGRLRLGVSVSLGALFVATEAHAVPAALLLPLFGGLGAAAGTVAAVAAFAVNTAITFGLSTIGSALFGPKASATAGQDRQAEVLTLSIGEVPREMVVGRAATGGSLIDCAYYGGKNGTDWNLFAVDLADHECDGLEGFYVNDTYVPWPFGPGNAGGPVEGYNGQLHVHFRPGRFDDAPGPGDWPTYIPALAQGALKGVCKVAFAYAVDAPDAKSPVWSGRPSFLWVLRGAKLYDPRQDDTVAGGAGGSRYADPATWTWSENASLCEYAYQRGVYALHQVDQPGALLVGRGLSALEAPPERVIAAANLCDEQVDAPGGGTEPRYRVGGVIKASDTFQAVAQMFADATAGVVTQPEGGVFVQPGQAQTPVATITDDDLLIGQAVRVQGFAGESDRVNTVVTRYIEPAQKWAETSAPVSRDLADLVADGGPHELPLSLTLVPYVGQAQRVGEIRRRKARLERSAAIVLGPRFAHLEEGDWLGWTSQRRFDGATVYFRVNAYGLDQAWRNTLALEEIDYAVYGFGGAGAVPVGPQPVDPPGALVLDDVEIVATRLPGDGGAILPAVEATWAVPVDPAISTVRLEVRVGEDGATAPTSTTNVSKGELITTGGVAAGVTNLQARLVPLGDPGRPVTPSPWTTLSTVDLVAGDTAKVGGTPSTDIKAMIASALAGAAANLAAVQGLQAQADSIQAQAHAEVVAAQATLQAGIDGARLDIASTQTQLTSTRTTLQASIAANAAAITQTSADLATARSSLLTSITAAQADATSALANSSANAAALVSLNSSYGALQATVTSNAATLTAADTALGVRIDTVSAATTTAVAAVSAETFARTTADAALGARIDTVTATAAGNAAAITQEAAARSAADGATATRLDSLSAYANAGANLMPGVEAGLGGWSYTDTPFVASTGAWGPVATSNTPSGTGVQWATPPSFPVSPGLTYTVSADLLYFGAAGDGALLSIQWIDSAGSVTDGPSGPLAPANTDFSASRPRSAFAVTGTAPSTAGRMQVRVLRVSSSGRPTAFGVRRLKAELGPAATAYSTETSTTTVAAAVTSETLVRVTALTALSARVDNIVATAGGGAAAIDQEAAARANADGALASRIDTVSATLASTSAAVGAEQSARVSADGALASRIDTVSAAASANAAAVTAEQTARANADGAISSRIDAVTAFQNAGANLMPPIEAGLAGWSLGDLAFGNGPFGPCALAFGLPPAAARIYASPALSVQGGVPYCTSADLVYFGAAGDSLNLHHAFFRADGSLTLDGSPSVSAAVANTDFSDGRPRSTFCVADTAPADAATLVVYFVAASPNGAAQAVGIRRVKTERGLTPTIYSAERGVSVVSAAVAGETLARTTADTAAASRIDGLTATVAGNTAAVLAEQTARSSADLSIASRIDTLTATVGGNAALVTSEQLARASGDTALASRIDAVTAFTNASANLVPGLEAGLDGYTGGLGLYDTVWGRIATLGAKPPGPTSYQTPAFFVAPTATYVGAADLLYFGAASDFAFLQLAFYDTGGNFISAGPQGPYAYGNTDFSNTRARAAFATPPSQAPAGAVSARLTLFLWNTTAPMVTGGWRQIKVERGSTPTAYTAEATVKAVSAAVVSEAVARTTSDTAAASRIDGVVSAVGGLDSRVSTEITTRSTGDTALGSRIDTVSSNSNAVLATVVSEITTRANADSALGSRIDTVTATMNGLSTTVTATTTALATVQGQFYGSYGLQVNANGNIAGFMLYAANGPVRTSGLLIEADQLILRKAGSSVIPFLFDTNTSTAYLQNVAILGNLIVAGTVTTATLQPNTVSDGAAAQNPNLQQVSQGSSGSLAGAAVQTATSAARVLINGSVYLNPMTGAGSGTQATWVSLDVLRNGTSIYNTRIGVGVKITDTIFLMAGNTIGFATSDTPGLGAFSYVLRVTVDSSSPQPASFYGAAINLVRLDR